jgi:hypothetical protein
VTIPLPARRRGTAPAGRSLQAPSTRAGPGWTEHRLPPAPPDGVSRPIRQARRTPDDQANRRFNHDVPGRHYSVMTAAMIMADAVTLGVALSAEAVLYTPRPAGSRVGPARSLQTCRIGAHRIAVCVDGSTVTVSLQRGGAKTAGIPRVGRSIDLLELLFSPRMTAARTARPRPFGFAQGRLEQRRRTRKRRGHRGPASDRAGCRTECVERRLDGRLRSRDPLVARETP